MKRQGPVVFLYLLFSLFAQPVRAQQALWKKFNIDNGLPVSTITAITETKDGVLWLGSEEGLIRYDGISFKKISGPANTSLPYITALVTAKNNDVWVGTRTGLWRYTPGGTLVKFKTSEHTPYFNDLKWNKDSSVLYAATSMGVKGFYPDSSATLKEKISEKFSCRVFLEGDKVYAFDFASLVSYRGKQVDTVFTDPGGYYDDIAWIEADRKWLLVSKKKMLLVDEDKKVSPFSFPFPVAVHKVAEYQALYITHDQHIWLNCADTLYDFKSLQDAHPQVHFKNKDNPYSIAPDLLFMYEDHQHNAWLGTVGNGLNFRDVRLSAVSFLHPHQANADRVWDMFESTEERIWFAGTNDGVRICKKLGEGWISIPNPLGMRRFTVTNVTGYDKDHWAVSTFGAGLWLLNKKTYQYSQVPFLKEPHNTNGFVSFAEGEEFVMTTGCLYRFNRTAKTATVFNDSACVNPICMIKASDDTYWIGMGAGLVHASKDGRILHRFFHDEHDSTSLRSHVVFSLYEGPDKKIYIATMNGGLNCYDPATGKVSHITLVSDPTHAYGLMKLDGKQLLLTTSNGLYLYQLQSGTSQVLNKRSGLPYNDFDQYGYLLTKEYFVGMGAVGLLFIPRNEIASLFKRTFSARLFVNDQQSNNIVLQPGEKTVSAVLSAGASQSNDHVVFQYRMNGLEDTWHELNAPYELNYNYIPPGDYELHIRRTDPNALAETSNLIVAVTVLPLWWQTVWFRILVVLTGITCVVMLARYFSWLRLKWKLRRIEAEQKVAKERLRISRELHDNVGSQLTYLISGLEASEIMLQKQHTGKLVQNLEQLQLSARESMQQLRDAIWALNKEEMQLSVLTQRFREWAEKITGQFPVEMVFDVQIIHDTVLDPLKALNFFRMMQEAVHNALKHAEATQISITITGNDEGIGSVISDNGKGFVFDAAVHSSGLTGMHHRAAEIGGTCHIESKPGKGTRITFRIPK